MPSQWYDQPAAWLTDAPATAQALDIGTVRAALCKLGVKRTDADRLINSALAAGADADEVTMIRWCLARRMAA